MIAEAIIIINDEVTCKITGLDADIRRQLSRKFDFEVPGARFTPAVRLGRWNGKISYFSISGSTYVNLLDEIIPIIIDAGYNITLDDRRKPKSDFKFKEITDQFWSNSCWPVGHERAGQQIVIRDYQVNIINNFLRNVQSLQEAATGSGKTLVAGTLSKLIEPYGRSLVIVPSKTLVEQTEADYVNLGMDVGVYFGDRKDYGKSHTICTWQSLNNVLNNKDIQTDPNVITGLGFIDNVVCTIVDEAHSVRGTILKDMLTGPLANIPIRWGLTGTIPKEPMSAAALLISVGPVIGKLSANELQERGVLANCHVHIKQLKDKVEYKDYNSELKFLLGDPQRLDKMAAMIQEISSTGNTLVLIGRVNAGKELAKRISGSVFISGGTKTSKRKEEYDDFSTLNNKILIATPGIASTGINLPRIYNLVFIEVGKSFIRVIQSIGRGLRKAEDKDEVSIWDICSTSKFSKRHLAIRKAMYNDAKYPFSLEKITY